MYFSCIEYTWWFCSVLLELKNMCLTAIMAVMHLGNVRLLTSSAIKFCFFHIFHHAWMGTPWFMHGLVYDWAAVASHDTTRDEPLRKGKHAFKRRLPPASICPVLGTKDTSGTFLNPSVAKPPYSSNTNYNSFPPKEVEGVNGFRARISRKSLCRKRKSNV